MNDSIEATAGPGDTRASQGQPSGVPAVVSQVTEAMTHIADASRSELAHGNPPGIDAGDMAMPAVSSPPTLDRDRRDHLERFADHQLNWLATICQSIGDGNPPVAAKLHEQWTRSLVLAKSSFSTEDWTAAAYPLAVTIDECLLELNWPGQRWWEDHVLESTLFGTRVGSQRFFELARQLVSGRPEPIKSTLLRIHHECVAVGFRGLYATPSPVSLAQPLGLPVSLSQWRNEIGTTIGRWETEIDTTAHPNPADQRTIPGAPPLRFHATTWVLGVGCVIAIAINLLLWSGTGQ